MLPAKPASFDSDFDEIQPGQRAAVAVVGIAHDGETELFWRLIAKDLPVIRDRIGLGFKPSTGFADIPVLGKYRFYQNDRPGRTTRWAVVGGAEVPSFDSTFSSESLNPIIGTVWTHQRLEWWVDWSVQYQFITARWIAEAGIQLPAHQDMKSPRPETDFATVASFRFQF